MDRTKPKFIISLLLAAALSWQIAGCKKNHPIQEPMEQLKSSQKNILSFEILKSDNSNLPTDYNSSVAENTITATLPSGVNLTALKVDFTVSEKATVLVNGNLQTSRVSANDYSQPVVYTVKAEDGSTKNYTVTIISK